MGRALLIGLLALTPLHAHAQEQPSSVLRTPESFVENWRAARTLGMSLAFNGVMTLYGRYIMKEPGDPAFVVSIDTIHNNLKNGLEWDDNSFSANNFRHPWQGSMYHGVARANGYDFYQSAAWAFAGSWLWEYTGEGHQPAYNDMVNTTMGGIAFGEGLFRLSTMVLDNTDTGASRQWREIGGLLMNPLRGVNRLLTGEWFKVHQNPTDRMPSRFGGALTAGTRTLGSERVFKEDTTRAYIALDLEYGDPFEDKKLKPYDVMRFGLELTFNNAPRGISRFQTKGTIVGGEVGRTENTQHKLFLTQHFDYVDNEAYTFGGQTLAASLLSRGFQFARLGWNSEVHGGWIVLGGVRSDYGNISGREYDYGPGAAVSVRFNGTSNGRNILGIGNSAFWVKSLNGNDASHFTNLTWITAQVPIRGNFALGARYLLYLAERNYADFDDVSRRSPELRLYASFGVD